MTDTPAALTEIHDRIWEMLEKAASSRHHGFHLPTLATVDAAGQPTARIVVLRSAARAGRSVTCHTDARAPKVCQLAAQPLAAWVFYDAEIRVQVRAVTEIAILDPSENEVARGAWDHTNLSSRRCYMAPAAPSSVSAGPSPNLPESVRERLPTDEESQIGRKNFRVVKATVREFDYLHLAHNGHQRARFVYHADGVLQSTWLEP